MLFADGSDFPNVVDEADVSLCGSVTFTDPNVPKPLQEVGPGVGSDPVPQGQSHFVVSVVVPLQQS